MAKKVKKNISAKLSHFAIMQKLAQHCKSTILQLKKREKRKDITLFNIKDFDSL